MYTRAPLYISRYYFIIIFSTLNYFTLRPLTILLYFFVEASMSSLFLT